MLEIFSLKVLQWLHLSASILKLGKRLGMYDGGFWYGRVIEDMVTRSWRYEAQHRVQD